MNTAETLKAFAKQFVNAEYRDRFVHDALKKPDRLYTKICHSIEEVFSPSLKGGKCTYRATDQCLVFRGGPSTQETWQAASIYMDCGDGLLVIGLSGAGFYAETESSKGSPSEVYAAGNGSQTSRTEISY
jgi:hypothetical protein